MHETLIEDVKLHVDSVNGQDDELNIVGWCASASSKVDNVRLSKGKESFVGVYGKERKDVQEHYENKDFLNSGFSISIPRKFKDAKDLCLEVLKKKAWTKAVNIEGAEAWSLTEEKKTVDFKISKKLNPELIVIDDFYENPDEIRDFALSRGYAPHLEYHKGQRTESKYIPDGIKETLETLLRMEITSWEDQGANGVFQFCTAEDSLVYHVDAQTYAAVVFLTPNAPVSCGTTFFKSKSTGLLHSPTDEDSERIGRSKDDLSFEIFKNNFYDKTDLEVVDVVGNVYNRLVIWDAKLIHAASEYFGDQKQNSRLFHMFFFDAK
jgi:hypothetical protein